MSLSLVGKVMTNKLVNGGTFIGVMKKVWQVAKGVEIDPVKRNLFRIQFKCEEDRHRVMTGGHWTFDSAIIVLEKPLGKGIIENMSFCHSDF
ncbi:hypothetical protein Dsin_026822 [Dipteronia sinensis]|uniref:DUF4283 domain-containing protein n=1 Tax=Dipteronia sinensis TaxID=43782 RepID=A0AAE0DY87_9ROSI|nr:hypothetical protein Dsin_026822 [Dipteronia sinensis]